MTNNIQKLSQLGQSIWYDNIRRKLIDSGGLQKLVDQGVVGVTSNPSIFDKAIAGTTDYDQDLQSMVASGKSIQEIYEVLALKDISQAADILLTIYQKTGGMDGYISLEVNPGLAHDTEGTIAEARRLFHTLNRPNIMIKVPATQAGIPAISTLIGEGININVTLIFAIANYLDVADAYLTGLETLAKQDGDLTRIASVASFFVSRVDTAVDAALAAVGDESLQGKIAVANAKVAYQCYQEIFSGPRWEALKALGARPQRVLWASTSTKNPAYPDTLYLDELIGPNTVNTVPPATLDAFLDHGKVVPTLAQNVNMAQDQIARLAQLGIDLDTITDDLQTAGVASFYKSFVSLMDSISEKFARLQAAGISANLGKYQEVVDNALKKMAHQNILNRIWEKDFSVWNESPTEITNRLGWLESPQEMLGKLPVIQQFVNQVRTDGYTDVLLLGMGGSSLAPEVFSRTFGTAPGYLRLAVLDTTDPGAVKKTGQRLDLARTLFIVATKSGGTVETLSAFKYFYNQVVEAVGVENAGEHFIGITDPGSKVVDLAQKYHFRGTFLNNPNIGGRYSALSYFGLLPAALIGVDLSRLLNTALEVFSKPGSGSSASQGDNQAGWLGAIMGELAKAGHDKVTFMTSPEIASFGDWVEQLIAESTGKSGTGILPVVGEPPLAPHLYGDDRLFVHLSLAGDASQEANLAALASAGHPVVRIQWRDFYDLGYQFFLWELATAVAGHLLSIQPFDQPNVEAAKIMAREMVAAYHQTGKLPSGKQAEPTGSALEDFLSQTTPGDYIAIQAYLEPTPETDAALGMLRKKLLTKTRLAITLGYGPRFLHSTGQLHKGDRGNGLFIIFTDSATADVPIPDEAGKLGSSMTFGVLKLSQALGDMQALKNAVPPRRVIRFHLNTDPVSKIEKLAAALS